MPVDFAKIRRATRVAAETAFAQVRAAHSDEHFYAFALYTDDGAMTIMPAANTEEGMRRTMGANVSEANYYRWATGEWEYEAAGEDAFESAYHLLNIDNRYDEIFSSFAAFQEQLIETMTLSLADLASQGFFGIGADREAVTLFVSVSDSDASEAIETASAQRLNSPVVYERFDRRYQ